MGSPWIHVQGKTWSKVALTQQLQGVSEKRIQAWIRLRYDAAWPDVWYPLRGQLSLSTSTPVAQRSGGLLYKGQRTASGFRRHPGRIEAGLNADFAVFLPDLPRQASNLKEVKPVATIVHGKVAYARLGVGEAADLSG